MSAAIATPHAQSDARRSFRFEPSRFFDHRQLERLRGGAAVVAVPDASHSQVAMAAAIRTDIRADRLVAWSRQLHRMYAGHFAPVGGRFSTPPRIEDLNTLTLTAQDLQDLRKCRPADCGVKLAAEEMAAVRSAMESAGSNWRPAGIEAFRKVLVARATAFLARGLVAAPPYSDHRKPVSPATELAAILSGPERALVSPLGVDEYLRRFPRPARGVESLLFWSKNVASGAREVVNITHVAIFRSADGNDVVVAESQVFASHYLEASVAYITLSGESPDRYLAYLRRTQVDVLRGTFGGILRRVLERRVKSDAPRLLMELRRKLESGEPPSAAVDSSRR